MIVLIWLAGSIVSMIELLIIFYVSDSNLTRGSIIQSVLISILSWAAVLMTTSLVAISLVQQLLDSEWADKVVIKKNNEHHG